MEVCARKHIYAVIAHSLAQRTVEIGIRMAMGASPARVTGLMLRYGLLPALVGMAVGWSGAFAISRFFSSMLFGVGPLDPPTWGPRFLLDVRRGVHRELPACASRVQRRSERRAPGGIGSPAAHDLLLTEPKSDRTLTFLNSGRLNRNDHQAQEPIRAQRVRDNLKNTAVQRRRGAT
jgi:ABC-type antimicrobial peptide transport system permease subunit